MAIIQNLRLHNQKIGIKHAKNVGLYHLAKIRLYPTSAKTLEIMSDYKNRNHLNYSITQIAQDNKVSRSTVYSLVKRYKPKCYHLLNRDPNVKPFFRYLGSKGTLLKLLIYLMPSHFRRYLELFGGSGSFLLGYQFHNSNSKTRPLINDNNYDIWNVFRQVKENPSQLIRIMKLYEQNMSHDTYYYLRNELNNNDSLNPLKRGAIFATILNNSYSGLIRYSRHGKLTTSYGGWHSYKHNIFERIRADSRYLKSNNVEIRHDDYFNLLNNLKPNDFVFLDPPYYQADKRTYHYNTYFDKSKQIQLAHFCHIISDRGVRFIETNSDTLFTRKLYYDFNVIPFKRSHAEDRLGHNARKKKYGEIIIKNY